MRRVISLTPQRIVVAALFVVLAAGAAKAVEIERVVSPLGI